MGAIRLEICANGEEPLGVRFLYLPPDFFVPFITCGEKYLFKWKIISTFVVQLHMVYELDISLPDLSVKQGTRKGYTSSILVMHTRFV